MPGCQRVYARGRDPMNLSKASKLALRRAQELLSERDLANLLAIIARCQAMTPEQRAEFCEEQLAILKGIADARLAEAEASRVDEWNAERDGTPWETDGPTGDEPSP